MALIIVHPHSGVNLEPAPPDPRDPPVMRDDLCTPCGQPRDAHFTAGNRKMGCDYALKAVARAKAAVGPWCDTCGRALSMGTGPVELMGVGVFCSSRCATTGSLQHADRMQR